MPTATDDILRVAARQNVPGIGDFVNVFHYKCISGAPISDADTLADMGEFMDMLYTKVQAIISSYADPVDVNVFNVTQDRPLGSTPFPVWTGGTATGDAEPAQVAAFIRGLSGYSRNWAKKFIGPLSESRIATIGLMDGTTLTALGAFGAEWVLSTATSVGGYIAVVYHSSAGLYRAINSVAYDNVPCIIRRRRAGIGS